MYNRKEICSCKTLLDNQKEFIYRYFLIESSRSVEVDDSKVTVPCYGISIIKEENVDGNTRNIEEESLECMTSIKDKVVDLIGILRDHEVSPVHLVDIAGEKADEWVCDFEGDAISIMDSLVYL